MAGWLALTMASAYRTVYRALPTTFKSSMPHPGVRQNYYWPAARQQLDYGSKTDPRDNSISVALIEWFVTAFCEAPLRVRRLNADGEYDLLLTHPVTQLIRRPNKYYSFRLLEQAFVADFVWDGNGYLFKRRSSLRRPSELWWIPCHLIEPIAPADPNSEDLVSHYEYRPSANKVVRLERGDVIHLRNGLDPHNPRKGFSRLKAVLREIFTDDEAAIFSAAMLHNMGVPGVLISPDSDIGDWDGEDVSAIKQNFAANFGGQNRGLPLVLGQKSRVEVMSFSPDQMNLKDLRRIPEERVSAVLGIPAIVAGLGAGLDRSTFSNVHEAREMAYESRVIPIQMIIASELDVQLLDEYGQKDVEFFFDTSAVRVLQEDQDALWKRVDMAVRGGWMMLDTAQKLIGAPVEDGSRVYLRPVSTMEIGPDADPLSLPISRVPGDDEPAEPALKAGTPEVKSRRLQAATLRALQRIEWHVANQMERDLSATFASMATELVEQILSRDAVLAGVTPNGHTFKAVGDDWPASLRVLLVDESAVERLIVPGTGEHYIKPVLEKYGSIVAESVYGAVSTLVGVSDGFNLNDPQAIELIRTAGSRYQFLDIDGQTRKAILSAVADGREAGDSAIEIADRITGYTEGRAMYPGVYQRAYDAALGNGESAAEASKAGDTAARGVRAQTIARTEVGYGVNISSVRAYEQSEVIDAVIVFDGTDDDDECRAAHGQVWTFDEALARPKSHPRCRRNFAPRVRNR